MKISGVFLAVSLMAVAVAGCSSLDRSVALAKQDVTQIAVGEAAAVPALLLAKVMLRAGFEEEAVLRYGPSIRNALATSGGAQVRMGHVTEALFAVHSERLYVTSRQRGTFVEPIQSADNVPGSTGNGMTN
jgi:hypothetical protein